MCSSKIVALSALAYAIWSVQGGKAEDAMKKVGFKDFLDHRAQTENPLALAKDEDVFALKCDLIRLIQEGEPWEFLLARIQADQLTIPA